MGFIKFDNGACLQIEFSWASNIDREKRYVELRGTKSGMCWKNGVLEIFTEEAVSEMTTLDLQIIPLVVATSFQAKVGEEIPGLSILKN